MTVKSDKMRAPVNRIIPFSSVDGPGNRTVIFLQGCNINCKYCHNPETRELCIKCGECVKTCPTGALSKDEDGNILYDYDICIDCDTCIKTCKHDSTPKIRLLSPKEAYEIAKQQIPFIRGITVSGGECMLHPEFIEELFALAKQDGLSTLIDSNGTVDFSKHPQLLSVTDGVMLDIKSFNEADHIAVTGYTNKNVLKNAVFLLKNSKLEEVRVVVVEELYSATKSIDSIGKLLSENSDDRNIRVKIIAYRPIGVREQFSHYQIPKPKLLNELKEILIGYGFDNVVII